MLHVPNETSFTRQEKAAENFEDMHQAKTMLVLMLRGLTSSLEFPYAQFACQNVTGEQLYNPVTEAIFRLERLGLKVNLTLTSFSIAYVLCIHHRY